MWNGARGRMGGCQVVGSSVRQISVRQCVSSEIRAADCQLDTSLWVVRCGWCLVSSSWNVVLGG